MSGTRIGRNDPCPCGSGRKYKHCCLRRESGPPPTGGPRHHDGGRTAIAELREALAEQGFSGPEDAERFMRSYVARRDRTPLDDFQGLTPGQMDALLYRPFDAPDVIDVPEVLDSEPSAPILELFTSLVEALGEDGLKATTNGNLPRAFCKDAAERYFTEERDFFGALEPRVNREEDFRDLVVARHVSRTAGLIRLYRGRFLLTRKARELLDEHGAAGIYPQLLRAYVTKFAWGSQDGYPEFAIVQRSWAFTAYLLTRFGDATRDADVYSQAFRRAFPAVMEEAQDRPYRTSEEEVDACYRTRALVRFAGFLGLARIERAKGRGPLGGYRVAASDLLSDAVRFPLADGPSLPSE